MKRTLMALLFIPLLLLAACSDGRTNADGGSAGAFTADDLSLTVGGSRYTCNMDIEQVIAGLGDGYEYAEGMSCDYDGMDKSYLYDTVQFYTNPLSQGDMVNEIYTEDPSVSTTKGVTVGSSRADVLAAYGDDCEDEGDLLIYRMDGDRTALCFELDGDTVWAIYLTIQSV